ncbi:MAG: hypothetical protein KDA55_21550, partial [Planctomycetales bacterium]|nr:hypothetical protein [Planctomycetales bacterium]
MPGRTVIPPAETVTGAGQRTGVGESDATAGAPDSTTTRCFHHDTMLTDEPARWTVSQRRGDVVRAAVIS